MKKTRIASFMMALALVLLSFAGCGSEPSESVPPAPESSEAAAESDENEIKDLVLVPNFELEGFNFLHSYTGSQVLIHCWEGHIEVDPEGNILPCMSESWESDEETVEWLFHIRKGVKWVDVDFNEMADVTAHDFVTALEWVLNFHKNDGTNTYMVVNNIKGAQEYLDYTRNLSKEEAYKLTGTSPEFADTVGVKALDDYTVKYTCLKPTPYFSSVTQYTCFAPISQKLIDKLGVEGIRSMDNKSMWYNGCYTMPYFVHNNEKVLAKNPKYWDKDCKRFDTVTYKITDDANMHQQLYEAGEINKFTPTESQIRTILANPDHKLHNRLVPDLPGKYSFQILFNYDKTLEDGKTPDVNWNKAAANKAFRQCFWYGIDFENYYRYFNVQTPYICQNNYFTLPKFSYTSDGVDYTELVRERLDLPKYSNDKMVRYNPEKFEELKKQAIEELTAEGVTFPVKIDHYIKSGSQAETDEALIFKTNLETSLGKDFVNVNICEYISNRSQEVVTPKRASIYLNGWGPDYLDPSTNLLIMLYNDPSASYAKYSNINSVEETSATKELIDDYKKLTELIRKADAICNDMDARYNAFADAEAFLIENALAVPTYVKTQLCVTDIYLPSLPDSCLAMLSGKLKNVITNKNGYTVDDFK